MMCFRDMTFCNFHETCSKAGNCDRALTPEVSNAADKWWGKPGAPICVFTQQPDCHTPVENNDGEDG